MSNKKRARFIQDLTGFKYMVCLQVEKNLSTEVTTVREQHPDWNADTAWEYVVRKNYSQACLEEDKREAEEGSAHVE